MRCHARLSPANTAILQSVGAAQSTRVTNYRRPDVGALMSRRKIMISLSPPIKPTAHARFPVGTRSSEKLGGRSRDVNMPRLSVLFIPRFPLRIFYRLRGHGEHYFDSIYFPRNISDGLLSYVILGSLLSD